jgi:hypothetical protein
MNDENMELMKAGLLHGLFEKCISRSKDGRSINCRKGLWGVSSNCRHRTEQESFHYWRQYYNDGEYDGLLFNS